ncbi:MAG: putative signal-transduction sensor protein [Gallionellaceae bacterium]|nr:MAG: putative signal-transduction sensor protein [Gallionellaceae bacterium]
MLDDSDIIVSKTDLKGRITYANRVFMRIANYPENGLLHQQHNIVRHPDMPRGAFKLLWDTIQAKQEFFAYVKNMTAEGHYYWVYANVTPDMDEQGRVVGYFSVRRKPKPSAIAAIQPVYREMLEAERQAGPARAVEASVALLTNKLQSLGTTYERFILDL